MDWFKKHFDRVILAALGILLIAFAGLIFLRTQSFNEAFETRNSAKARNNNVPLPATELVRERIASLQNPRNWGKHEGSLFISEPYVSRNGGPPLNPLHSQESLYPPIENQWLEQYHLDFSDANLPNADPDNDKFSNLEEFIGKTDPTDPKAIPPYYTKLRLLQFIQVPFRLKFSGSPGEGTYSINTMDLRKPTQFLKIGEMVEGTPYKLINYEKKTTDKNGLVVDVSEVTIENQETGQKIVLVNDQVVNDPTVFALFKYLWDGSEIKVKKNDTFSIKPEEEVKYKLIDISDSEAVIENPQGTKIKVPKAGS